MSLCQSLSYYNYIALGVMQSMSLKDVSMHYGRTPTFPETIRVSADLFNVIGHVLFVLVLVFIAKGKSITRSKISATGKMKISIYFSLYICLLLIVVIWKWFLFDPALVLIEQESPPGMVLVVAR